MSEYPILRGSEERVNAQISIQCRRPSPLHAYRLLQVLQVSGEPVYDRHATEADFFRAEYACEERDVGEMMHALWDHRLLLHVSHKSF